MSKPDTKIYLSGKFDYTETGEGVIVTLPTQRPLEEVPHPGFKLVEREMVYTDAMGQYGQAETIEQLNEAVPGKKDLFWVLFELAATFPTLNGISIDVTSPVAGRAVIETPTKDYYVVWTYGGEKVFVSERPFEEGEAETEPKAAFIPSELLYGFSIIAEHIRLGSTRFYLTNYTDQECVTISFFDHEMVDFRVNLKFPLMKARETTAH